MSRIKDRCILPLLYFAVLNATESIHPPLHNKVEFLNPPHEPVSEYLLRVQYSCSVSAVVHLEALVSTDTTTAAPVFQRHWSCEPGLTRIRALTFQLPDSVVYQADWLMLDADWLFDVTMRAWITGLGTQSSYQTSLARDLVQLQPVPPFSRPLKEHQLCLRWDKDLLWRIHGKSVPQCPEEQEVAPFISFLFASTGENFGITRTLHPYRNKVLEQLRLKTVSSPWCMISAWLFLTQHCKHHLCGVLHHVDYQKNYSTPAIFLTSSGQFHIQVTGEDGKSVAFLVSFQMPLGRWCCIQLAIRGKSVDVVMVCVDGEQHSVYSAEHRFKQAVHLDDTDGHFILGGSHYVKGIEGFFGPSLYYRNRIISSSKIAVPELIREINLTGWFESCQLFQKELYVKMTRYSQKARQSARVMDTYSIWAFQEIPPPAMSHCELWEAPPTSQRRPAVRLAQILATKHGAERLKLKSVGKVLYSRALRKLTQERPPFSVRGVMPLLLQAGCLGDMRALFLSSVLYNSGLGVKRQPKKARLLSLLAAQQDWRLALLQLGHLHHLGEQDVPADAAQAYAYYSNIAAQTAIDRQNPSAKQKFVESIHLSDEDMLKLQTSEDDDLFLWLKHQARRGVAEAEQAVGRMLFWGQQGVSPNLQAAVKHYERGAVQLEDTVSMYDYAIVLLKGQGVKQDIPRAVSFLKKAAERDFVAAINALGWYYEHYKKDYARAVELWERADGLGSPEAAMNLGVMYSQGHYPGKLPDKFTAYTYYLKSAERRSIDGAIQLAEVWIRGIPGQVNRLPVNAVLWTKWVAEQNGYLGTLLRTGLDAYLRQDWPSALVWFLMAAESGFATAQFNVAYLCEHNPGSFLDEDFVTECMWRYYNLSIQAQEPAPYALLKMGDLMYDGHARRQRDVTAAAHLYKRAALKSHPQGWYSLGLLVQDGVLLPGSLLAELDLWELHGADNHTVLSTFYQRCRDHSDTEAYLPCSFALIHAHLLSAWKLHSSTMMLFSTVTMAVASLLVLLLHLGRPLTRPEDHTANGEPAGNMAAL
ncbi:protein sel-1 homolog 3 isoform X1 [Brienomyrus brachyistius]|uniref:protein sel-1 homolog 3 isoform X1 n=1 Tax=Brienomyrus brachyistius TaxID=42636 RepID=UPI0020B354DA|nr:protein sel-1 homolog 3 isoform X1 [Brienomyrus brachyistius]